MTDEPDSVDVDEAESGQLALTVPGEDRPYPHRWRKEFRGGYGYVRMVPCRVIHKGRARWTIAALRADGTEAVRTVKPENVSEAPQ